jgi:hypothetical protein
MAELVLHSRSPAAAPKGSMRSLVVCSLLVFVSATAGCQFSEKRYLSRPVTKDEVTGTWRATEFAVKSLRDIGVRDHLTRDEHTLVFKADGSCTLSTIVNMPPSQGGADYRTYDTGCRWQLARADQQVLQLQLNPAPPRGAPYYYFGEESGHLILWQYASDPDAWRYMEFERASAGAVQLSTR